MIQLIPQLRILLACKPIDFRNGIDGLAALCKRELAAPFRWIGTVSGSRMFVRLRQIGLSFHTTRAGIQADAPRLFGEQV